MSLATAQPDLPDPQTALLLKAVEVLLEELSTLSSEEWEKLPELKKTKVRVASRMRQLRAEAGPADGELAAPIESLVADLEDQAQENIRARLDLIGRQIVALQELDLYWRECLNVSFRRTSNRPLGNGAPVV